MTRSRSWPASARSIGRARRHLASGLALLGVAALTHARAPAQEPPAPQPAPASPALPSRLGLAPRETVRAHVEISLASTFHSKDHRLRSLDDRATIAATLDCALGDARDDATVGSVTPVAVSFSTFEVQRQFKAKVAVFFTESEREGKGSTTWRTGDEAPPPSYRALLLPQGFLLADTTPVTSEAARWPGEAWLDPRDKSSDDDAKIRRLARATTLGTLLGAPALPTGGERHFEATFPVTAGESGLTNSFVDFNATFVLDTDAAANGLLRVHGPLARVALVKGNGGADKRVDRWLDVAWSRGGPDIAGELDALFDPARGCFREVKSRIALSHEGNFDGGRGKAGFERTVVSRRE